MDSFLACHNVFLGNKWAVSAARGNRKDAVTASRGAAIELLAVKLAEITTFVQHSLPFFPAVVHSLYIFLFPLYLFPAGAMKRQNNFFAGLCALLYIYDLYQAASHKAAFDCIIFQRKAEESPADTLTISTTHECLVSANWLGAL